MKFLFFDIDGTLYGKSRKLSENTKRVLKAAQKKGNKIFLCTGRALTQVSKELLDFGFDGIIASAGSCVLVGNKVIYEHSISPDLLMKVLVLFVNKNIIYCLETREGLYVSPGQQRFFSNLDKERYENNYELIRMNEERRKKEARFPVSHFDFTKPVYKITFVSKDKYNLLNCVKYIYDKFNIVRFSPLEKTYMNGELIIRSCTKADGIKQILDYYHGNIEDSIAFGDSMNDYQMLEAACTSVVYERAEEKLLELADYTFGDPDTNGIYKVIENLGLA